MKLLAFILATEALFVSSAPVGADMTLAMQSEDGYAHPACYQRVRHIHCYFAGGGLDRETNSNAYFNAVPNMVWFDKDGNYHALVNQCEITCKP